MALAQKIRPKAAWLWGLAGMLALPVLSGCAYGGGYGGGYGYGGYGYGGYYDYGRYGYACGWNYDCDDWGHRRHRHRDHHGDGDNDGGDGHQHGGNDGPYQPGNGGSGNKPPPPLPPRHTQVFPRHYGDGMSNGGSPPSSRDQIYLPPQRDSRR